MGDGRTVRGGTAFARVLAAVLGLGTAVMAEEPRGGRPPAAPAAPRATFEVDGVPFEPFVLSVSGDPANPRPGDVIFVNDIPLALGEGPAYRFRTADREADGRVYLLLPGGGERVVGARTRWTLGEGRGNPFVVRNLLEPLGDAEMRGLWGLHLDGWNEAIAARVSRIDPARTAVALTDSCGGPGRNRERPMPSLPPGLRVLLLDENSSEGMTDLAAIGEQRALVVFRTTGFSRTPLDLSLLRGSAATLRYLGLGRAKLESVETLGEFAGLVHLDIAGNDGIADLSFAARMPGLRRLDLSGSEVADLAPLGGLAALEEVDADGAKVARLPSGPLPALRLLRVMCTGVSAADAAAFAKAHPRCRVWHGWNEALRRELAAADRVVVRSGGTCHRDTAKEKRLAEVRGAAKAKELLGKVEVVESREPQGCLCCGDPSLEFYRGETLVATLGFHHGKGLRWVGGWPGDGMLTEASADAVIAWLAAHGATGPHEEREAERKEAAREAKEAAAFLEAFPAAARGYFLETRLGDSWKTDEEKEKAFAAGMAERCGGAEGLARSLCRALGVSSMGWTVSGGREQRAAAARRAVTGEAFAAAVASLRGDAVAMRGAARLAFQEGLLADMPPEPRAALAAPLGEAALSGGEPWYAWRVARALRTADAPATRALLWRMVKEPPPKGEGLPEPSLATAALLSLCHCRDADAVATVRRLLPSAADPAERQGLEAALALAGDEGLLRKEHFASDSWVVAFAAMDAVQASPRRDGIEGLVEAMRGGSVGFGWQLAEAFFGATGWSVPTEGRNYGWVHRRCLAWWDANGKRFLEEKRGR